MAAERGAVLDEGAERRDAGAGADHDDRRGAIGRQAEVLVRLDEDRHRVARFHEVREIGRADALALAAVGLVADGGHREMHLVGMGERAGSDRIKPRRQLAEDAGERIGGEAVRGEIDDRIDDLAAVDDIP